MAVAVVAIAGRGDGFARGSAQRRLVLLGFDSEEFSKPVFLILGHRAHQLNELFLRAAVFFRRGSGGGGCSVWNAPQKESNAG